MKNHKSINWISAALMMLISVQLIAQQNIPENRHAVRGTDRLDRLERYNLPELMYKTAGPAAQTTTNVMNGEELQVGNPVIESLESVLLDEGFESWEPEEWTFYQLGVQWLGWQQSDFQPNTGEYSAYHGYFAGGIHDNWMVTPQLTIDGEYQLIFWDRLTEYNYYDYSGVLISTGSGDPEDGEFTEVYNADDATPLTWTEQIVDLSDYLGMDIYIAFQYTGNNAHSWYVDDVKVSPLAYTDGGINDILNPPTGTTTVGGSIEEVTVELKNFGTETIEGADIEWSVNGEVQTPYTATGLTLLQGETVEVIIGTYDFTAYGTYDITASCSIGGDDNPANDSYSGTYTVDDLGDAGITGIWPSGSAGAAIEQEVSVSITNYGDLILESVEIEWEVNGEPQAPVIASNLNLLPDSSIKRTIGQHSFTDPSIYTILAGTNLPLDYVPGNDTMSVLFASGVLRESFEGPHEAFWPPDQWLGLNASALSDWPYEGDYMGHILSGASEFGSTDGWLATPLLDIQAGDEISFQLSFDMASGGGFSVQWMDGETGELNFLQSVSVTPGSWFEQTIDISAAEGINRIVFHVSSSAYAETFLDLVTSTAPVYTFEKDLEAMRFEPNWTPSTEVGSSISCSVRNYTAGDVAEGEYTVKLMETPGIELASLTGEAIGALETKQYVFNYTFTDVEQHNLYFEIEYADDQDPADNASNIVSIHPLPETAVSTKIGSGTNTSLGIPFNTFGTEGWGEDDFTQIIYTYEEIGSMGYIYGLKFHYFFWSLDYGQELPLTVWIGETENDNLAAGWEPHEIMTLVFDSLVITNNYQNEMFIPFDEPYVYTGGNIVVQIIQHDPSFPACWTTFWTTPAPGSIRSAVSPDWYQIDPENPPSFELETQHWEEYPDATFIFDPFADVAEVEGTVYDENSQPIEGATIFVEGTAISALTDEYGSYYLPNIPYGDWNLVSTMLGYEDNVQLLTIDENNEVLDFNMVPKPLIAISGYVEGTEQPGTGLEGVSITLSGYHAYEEMSGADGSFLIEDVFGNASYDVLVHKFGYESYSTSIIATDENVDLGTIILQERVIPVFDAVGNEDPDDVAVELSWPDPMSGMEDTLQYDYGDESYGLANEPYEDVWLGNLMPNNETITITSVTVFFINNDQFSGQVELGIFDANENLLVTSEPFYTQNDSYLTINFPNLTYDGDIYIMLHWKDNPATTHFLGIDFTLGIDDLCHIHYPGNGFQLLSQFLGVTPGVALIRANVLKASVGKGPAGTMSASSYNIYRGESNDFFNVSNWTQVNAGPVTDLEYLDESWLYTEPNEYRFAIEAIYEAGIAEVSFTNALAIDYVAPAGLNIDVDPPSGGTLFSCESPEHNVQAYDVFLDDMSTPLATGIDELSYVFDELTTGSHTAGVRAIYNTGSSEIAEIDFLITGIAPDLEASIDVYPNPARNEVFLSGAMSTEIIIYDLAGSMKLNFSCENNLHRVDLSGFENGIYIMRIVKDNEVVNRKIEVLK